jgi:SAM-dependent methyltransferase
VHPVFERFVPFFRYPYAHHYVNSLRALKNYLSKQSFKNLLDIGCGDGFFLRSLKQIYPDREFAGIDLSLRAIGFARAFTKDVEFIAADVTQQPFNGKRFDIVTSVAVWEHVPPEDLKSFVRAHYELLENGGRLLVILPSSNYPVTSKHYQHFDETSVCRLIDGFFVIKRREYLSNCRGIVSRLLSWLLGNNFFIFTSERVWNLLFTFFSRTDGIAKKENAFLVLYELVKLDDTSIGVSNA